MRELPSLPSLPPLPPLPPPSVSRSTSTPPRVAHAAPSVRQPDNRLDVAGRASGVEFVAHSFECPKRSLEEATFFITE